MTLDGLLPSLLLVLIGIVQASTPLTIESLLADDPYANLGSTFGHASVIPLRDDLVASSEATVSPISISSRRVYRHKEEGSGVGNHVYRKNKDLFLEAIRDVRHQMGQGIYEPDKGNYGRLQYLHGPPSPPLPPPTSSDHIDRRNDGGRLGKLDFSMWVQGLDGKYPRQPTDIIPKFDVDLDVITDHYTTKTSLPVAAAFHGFSPGVDGGEKSKKYDLGHKTNYELDQHRHQYDDSYEEEENEIVDRRSDGKFYHHGQRGLRKRKRRPEKFKELQAGRRKKWKYNIDDSMLFVDRLQNPTKNSIRDPGSPSESSKYFAEWTYWDDLPQKMKQLKKYNQIKELKKDLKRRNSGGALKRFNWKWQNQDRYGRNRKPYKNYRSNFRTRAQNNSRERSFVESYVPYYKYMDQVRQFLFP